MPKKLILDKLFSYLYYVTMNYPTIDLKYVLEHPKSYFTTSELADVFRISRQSVLNWVSKGKIEYLAKYRNQFIFSGEQVAEFLRENRGDGRFQKVGEILREYQLPAQRSEE